MNCLPSYTWL